MCGAAELDTFGKGLSQAVHLHIPISEASIGLALMDTTQRTKQAIASACTMHCQMLYAGRCRPFLALVVAQMCRCAASMRGGSRQAQKRFAADHADISIFPAIGAPALLQLCNLHSNSFLRWGSDSAGACGNGSLCNASMLLPCVGC